MFKFGLILTGGGARAAYQVGVLKAISDICGFKENPFKIISGVSAGAINGAWIGAQNENFGFTTQEMWEAWASLGMHQIFKTDPAAFLKIGTSWLRDLSFGGRHKSTIFTSLLDNSPLADFIKLKLDLRMLKTNIDSGKIHGIAVTATNYYSGTSVTFFDGHSSIPLWGKEWREARRTDLKLEHILASAAIPIFFSPVQLEDGFYGDGGIKLTSPFSPAIHMGAERILAIGIHHKNDMQLTPPHLVMKSISMGDVAGTLLNTLFFHSIEEDVERFKRINRTVSIMTDEQLAREPDGLRYIPLLTIQPSQDLGQIESELYCKFPKTIRYLLRGIGASDFKSWDLMSYLAFERTYVTSVLNLGYKDGLDKKEEIQQFFKA